MKLADKIRSGAAWNILGFILRSAIGLASSIIFVRLLGQKMYGTVTFILSAVFFAEILVNLGLGTVMSQTIAKARVTGNEGILIPMLKKITLCRGFMILLISIPFLKSELIANWIGKDFIAPYLVLVPLIVISTYYQGTLKTLLTSYYEQKYLNLASSFEMVIKLLLVILFIQLGYGIMGFLIALLLSQFINGTQLAKHCYQKVILKLKTGNYFFSLKENSKLALNSFLVAISIRIMGRESDLLLLGIFHPNIREVAIYAVVFGLPKMVFEIFGSVIGGGLGLTAFTELVKSGKLKELKKVYFQLLHFFSILLFPGIIGGIIVGGDLAVSFYGAEYSGLTIPLAVLFAALGLSSLISLTNDVLYALGHEKKLMFCQIGFGILNIIANILIIPQFGALGVAFTTAGASLGIVFTELFMIHQELKPNYPWRHWVRYLIISCMMGAIVYLIPIGLYWKIGTGIIIYAGLLLFCEAKFEKFKNLEKLNLKLAN